MEDSSLQMWGAITVVVTALGGLMSAFTYMIRMLVKSTVESSERLNTAVTTAFENSNRQSIRFTEHVERGTEVLAGISLTVESMNGKTNSLHKKADETIDHLKDLKRYAEGEGGPKTLFQR